MKIIIPALILLISLTINSKVQAVYSAKFIVNNNNSYLYIQGLFDTLNYEEPLCVPKGTNLAKEIKQYLLINYKILHLPAWQLVATAIEVKFNCANERVCDTQKDT